MGRITIFTRDNCPHCKRVKVAMEKRNIPYEEISLSVYPERQKDVYSLTKCMSVPQVFFNTRHVQGAKNTIQLLKEWDKSRNYDSPRKRYEYEIERFPSPSTVQLRLPGPETFNSPEQTEQENHQQHQQQEEQKQQQQQQLSRKALVTLPDGTMVTVLAAMEELKTIIPKADLIYHLTTYRVSFMGNIAVNAFVKHYGVSREQAVEFGKRLNDAQILHHVCGDHGFQDTNKLYYRLQCHQTPHILNSYRVWKTEEREVVRGTDCIKLVNQLESMACTIEADITDDEGKIHYRKANGRPTFLVLEEAVCELQNIDLKGLEGSALLAFRLNLYNLMLKFAFLKFGLDKVGTYSRPEVLGLVKFNIGGVLHSFGEWARRICKEARVTPYFYSVYFALGLNTWPGSCPPIQRFTPEKIQEELNAVAIAFCENDDHVLINVKSNTIRFLEMIKWHLTEFSIREQNLPMLIGESTQGTKKVELRRLLSNTNQTPKISFWKGKSGQLDILNFNNTVTVNADIKKISNLLYFGQLGTISHSA